MYIKFCLCPFPFDFEGGMWDLIVLIPGHCLSVYFDSKLCKMFCNDLVMCMSSLISCY